MFLSLSSVFHVDHERSAQRFGEIIVLLSQQVVVDMPLEIERSDEFHEFQGLVLGCFDDGNDPLAAACEEHAEQHRSEEHTSELQSRQYLVCRLLLEKKKPELHSTQYIV